MFLNNLNSTPKKLFIELAIKATESNGIVNFEQKNMLKAFALEMGINPIYHTERSTEKIIDDIIGSCSEKELKVILFEILGIIVVDGAFDDKEKLFVADFVKKCDIDMALVESMVNLLDKYVAIYKEIIEVVL